MPEEPANKARAWPIYVIALLLLLQAVAFVGLNFFYLSAELASQPGQSPAALFKQLDLDQPLNQLPPDKIKSLTVVISTILLAPLAIPAALAAVAFLFLLRSGWLLAMITQVAGLLFCLMLYLEFKPPVVYPLMAYCIVMVLYLNVNEVRLAFLAKSTTTPISNY
jgi:hypothetical protein